MSKFIFLEQTFSPRFKYGLDQAGATLVSGLTGAGSSLFGGLFGLESADDALSANVRENAKNRQFNAEQAELNRQFQHKERLQSQSWQAQQWYSQFMDQSREWTRQQDYANEQSYEYWLKQQQYNSPSEMVRRAQLAGLNPATMLGQNYGSTGLSAAPTSVPSSGGLPTSVPAGSAASVGLSNPSAATSKADSIASLFQGISSLTSAVAGSTKDNALANQINSLTPSLVEQVLKDNQHKDLLNAWQELENHWQPLIKEKSFDKLCEDLKYIMMQSILTGKEVELVPFKEKLLDWSVKHSGQQYEMGALQLSNLSTLLELNNKLIKSQISNNYAQSSYYGTSSVLNTDVHLRNEWDRMLRGQFSDGRPMSAAQFDLAQRAFESALEVQINNSSISDEQKRQAKAQANLLTTASDWRSFNQIMNSLTQIVGIGSALSMARNASKFSASHSESSAAYSRYVDAWIQTHEEKPIQTRAQMLGFP